MKGNVIVSVRVRPNLTGTDGSASDGDWVVDGRRGLISYKGKEGGVDYLYGAHLDQDLSNDSHG